MYSSRVTVTWCFYLHFSFFHFNFDKFNLSLFGKKEDGHMQLTYIISCSNVQLLSTVFTRRDFEAKRFTQVWYLQKTQSKPNSSGNNSSIFLLQINISYKDRSAHMVFVRINHIPCLTEKTEHKLQKICWQWELQHRKMVTYKGYKKRKRMLRQNHGWAILSLKGTSKF